MIIKFCGIRRIEDVRAVNKTHPDLAGFILVKGRKRYISPEKVCELKRAIDPSIKAVGVFIDEDIDEVRRLLSEGIIDIAQLHGNEPDEYIRELKSSTGATVIKAIGIRDADDVRRAEASPADLVIVDSPGGGTGSTFDWDLLQKIERPYILAGGINTDNITEAVERLHPYGVDVSSGIETDGFKDEDKMKAFMALIKKG